MSNPLYSGVVSDPDNLLRGCQTGHTNQYHRDLPCHASEQLPDLASGLWYFRIWSTEMRWPRAGRGRRGSPHPLPLCSARRRRTPGFRDAKSAARAPRRSLANPGQCRPAQHSGLAQRPNSGNMDCTGAPIRRFFNSAGARDREPNRRAARVLLVIGLSRFVQKGALPGSTYPGNEGSRPSTLKTYVTEDTSVKTCSA